VRLNTKAELAITAKEVDEKYLSKEMFRQFEKHIDSRFDSVQAGIDTILKYIKKD
jgi:outer membrane lipopolysaccharide assembly protein LptE/RlpB